MNKTTTICFTALSCIIIYSTMDASFDQIFNDQLEALENRSRELHDGTKDRGPLSPPPQHQSISSESMQQLYDLISKFRTLKKLISVVQNVEIEEESLVIIHSLKRKVAELVDDLNMANTRLLNEYDFLSNLPQYEELTTPTQHQTNLFQRSLKRFSSTFLKIITLLRTTITQLEAPQRPRRTIPSILNPYLTDLDALADALILIGASFICVHYFQLQSIKEITQNIQSTHTLSLARTEQNSHFSSAAPQARCTINPGETGYIVTGYFIGACGLLFKLLARCRNIYHNNHARHRVTPAQPDDETQSRILDIELDEIEQELAWIIERAQEHLADMPEHKATETTTATTSTSSGKTRTTSGASSTAVTQYSSATSRRSTAATHETSRLSDSTTE